jgi:NAD(P)-dependent dehydrogenase (short-subunit alcohol dehydrogenase family)
MERTVLITGASRGLGLALARGLAGRGWNLILTARDANRLRAAREELAARTHVAVLAGDITDAAHREALAGLGRGGGRPPPAAPHPPARGPRAPAARGGPPPRHV